MKIIRPKTNTFSMISSTTATEVYSDWSPSTNYVLTNKVVYTTSVYECVKITPLAYSSATTYAIDAYVRSSGNIYKSIQANNLNHTPASSPTWWVLISTEANFTPATQPLFWVKLSSSNKYAMFDGTLNSQTTALSTLTVTFKTGSIDSLAILNMYTTSVKITVRETLDGTIIYENYLKTNEGINDWYEYFFSDFINLKNSALFSDIPPYSNAYVTLEFVGGSIAIGEVLFGASTTLGITQEGLSAGIIDYSKKTVDDYGNISITKRAYSKKIQASVFIEQPNLNKVQRLLYDIRSTPVVWYASSDPLLEECVYTYGFYKDFTTTIQYPTVSMCNLEIEGLI